MLFFLLFFHDKFRGRTKLSWTSLQISIAGAKLRLLVLNDRIWDHGSMAELARTIFYLVCKAKATGNTEWLRKQCTVSCFEKLVSTIRDDENQQSSILTNPVEKEIAIIDVRPGKQNRPDMFSGTSKRRV